MMYTIKTEILPAVCISGGPGGIPVSTVWWFASGFMTARANCPGTWENSGGAVQAGETSRQAIARELFEETGIRAEEDEFELLESGLDGSTHYDYYCLRRDTPLSEIVLLPGETDDVRWATFQQVRDLIAEKKMCRIIARQFQRQEPMLLSRQSI